MYRECLLCPLYPLLFRMGLFWSSIICLTLGKLYGVSVETFLQFVARWKRSFNKADERTSDVGFDVFVIWSIKPYNISLSFAFLSWGLLRWWLEF